MRFDNELKFSTIVKAATAAVGVEVPTSLHQVSSNKYKTTTRRSHWASRSQDAEAYNASSRRKALVARTQVSLFRAPKPPFKMCLKPGTKTTPPSLSSNRSCCTEVPYPHYPCCFSFRLSPLTSGTRFFSCSKKPKALGKLLLGDSVAQTWRSVEASGFGLPRHRTAESPRNGRGRIAVRFIRASRFTWKLQGMLACYYS